ncbi:hypothetical protein [Halobaculum magnesiiphilum]|uniref:Uncharacterized protein n=1 Tax=Halobaculum magnesiiphilum TaxID=1017351 RepID=A0A8T8WAT5_9EURY|nr:hypothetical protein [Halobaculum magnesiiphilum]QZP36969.1 hypothetical protein K6T50_11795 [Halobaculum magnesiiphilum]
MNDQNGQHKSEAQSAEGRPSDTGEEVAFDRFPIGEWDALRDRVRDLDATATDSADEIAVDDGTARFVVTREGTVSGSMPRHEFARDGVDAVEVADDGSALRVHDADHAVEYVFHL